jgi:hypothetical protein
MSRVVIRRAAASAALLAACAVCAAPAASSPAALPTLYVAYTMNCTFSITDDNGRPVTVIPPGTYQISIRTPVSFAEVDLSGIFDMTACKGFVQFKLTGPGVSAFDNLGDGDNAFALLTETFQPGATYVAQDLNQPSVARLTFTTATSGSAGSPATPTSSSTSTKGSTQQPLVGSAASPFRGALDAIVFKTGKLSLSRNGKTVSFLKSGRWTFSVDDESTKAGFSVQVLHGKTTAVTGAAYTGSHDVTLQLKPGRWFFFTPGGKKSVFFVTS